jgi:hypothetical protein
MGKTFVMKNEWYRKVVISHYPHLNPDAIPIAVRFSLYRQIGKIIHQQVIDNRLAEIKARGIVPGSICYVRGEKTPSIVGSITMDGHVSVKGKRGTFHPGSISTSEEVDDAK